MAEQQVSDRVLTVPNAISFVRLLLVPVFAVLIVAHEDVWALVVLAASGLSDWVDGVIARRWDQVSRVGQVLDPAADRLFILVTLVGLAGRGVVPWWLVGVLLAREAMLGVVLVLLARRGWGPLPVHLAGKAGTLFLLYAFPLLLLAEWSGPVGQAASVLGWACAWWGTGLYWAAGILYVLQARRLVGEHR